MISGCRGENIKIKDIKMQVSQMNEDDSLTATKSALKAQGKLNYGYLPNGSWPLST